MSLSLLLIAPALAGYGVPRDGLPSESERLVILWTNAARVAPEDFGDDYAMGGCSTDDFSQDELTPKDPLYIDLMLTEAARYHSDDMAENGCFQHNSCDGTDTWARIGSFYTDSAGAMGENIAMGGASERYAVLSMWMCSHDGHRANIMSSAFNEMGAGVNGSYMTQDFAAGGLNDGTPPVRVAAPEGDIWYSDWSDADAPAELMLVRDGVETPMDLGYGVEERGIYSVASFEEDPEAECHHTWIRWLTSGGLAGTFPDSGSFGDGDCEDADGTWTAERPGAPGLFDDEVDEGDDGQLTDAMKSDVALVGCDASGGAMSLRGLGIGVGLLVARVLRRRVRRG